MITPAQMRKVTITGPKNLHQKTIDVLHKLGVYHVQDHQKDESFDIGTPFEEAEKLSELLVQTKSVLAHLGITTAPHHPNLTLKEVSKEVPSLTKEIAALVDERKSLEAKKTDATSQKELLDQLSSFSVPLEAYTSLNSVSVFVGTVDADVASEVQRISSKSSYSSKAQGDKILVSVFVDKAKDQAMQEMLHQHHFVPLDLKPLEGKTGAIDTISKEVESSLKSVEKDLKEIQQKLSLKSKDNGSLLFAAQELLETELAKAEAPLLCGTTKRLFTMTGWVPEKEVKDVEKELNTQLKNKLFIEVTKPKHDEDVPVKLDNPEPVKSYETLLNLYSWPRYGELDPSFLMVFTIPLFFGMMLGDMGYGAITLFLFLYLRKKFPQFKQVFNILIMTSTSAIIWGFLYGEAFGLEVIFGHQLWYLIHRAHDFNTVLLMVIGVGVVHVNFGLLLGFYNELKHHSLWHAITHKASWMLIQVSAVLWYLTTTQPQRIFALDAAAIFVTVLALFLLYKAEGLMGLIEIPSLISQIMSYARIMAVGLASVFLAILVNDIAAGLWDKGLLMFVLLGIPLLLIGHTFNIVLGTFSPFLHSVRLHYVEFFTKFYQGGGTHYIPFGKKSN